MIVEGKALAFGARAPMVMTFSARDLAQSSQRVINARPTPWPLADSTT